MHTSPPLRRRFGSCAACSLCLTIILLVLPAGALRAQPLADRVPADAMVYVGWGGCEQARDAYDGSHLKLVVDASDFAAAWRQLLPQALQSMSADDAQSAEQTRAWLGVLDSMRRYPMAMFLRCVPGAADASASSNGPQLRFAMLCRAGGDAPDLLRAAHAALDKGPCPLINRAEQVDDLVVLSCGYEAGERVVASKQPGTSPTNAAALSSTQPFREAIQQTLADPLASAYLDVERALDLLGQRIAGSEQESSDLWKKIRESSGLSGAKSWITGGKFQGPDWSVQTFLRTLGQRTGVLAALLDSGPVDPALIARVPKESSYVLQGTFDPARLLKEIRSAAAAADPQAGQMLDQALGAAQLAVGRNVQTEILDPVGDQWVLYTAPAAGIGSNNVLGLVAVNKPRDSAKAQKGLVSLTFAVNNLASNYLQQRGITASLKQQKLASLDPAGAEATLYYIDIANRPQLSPAWVVQDGFLYLGPTKEAVIAAANFRGAGKTIAESGELQRLKALLNVPGEIGGLEFADLNQTVDDLYREVDQNKDAWLKSIREQGVQLDKIPLPPLEKLKQNLSRYLRVSWTDQAGYHSKTIEPFPLSGALAQQKVGGNAVAGIGGVTIGALTPSLMRARETANRVKCAANMRQIGMACQLYASENNGKYPPDVATMLKTQDITWEVFTCPDTSTSLPGNLKAPDDVIGWIAGRTDYVYLGQSLTTTSPPNKLVLCEDLKHHGDGCNMLFADGHVEFVLRGKAQEWITAGERPQNEPLPGS